MSVARQRVRTGASGLRATRPGEGESTWVRAPRRNFCINDAAGLPAAYLPYRRPRRVPWKERKNGLRLNTLSYYICTIFLKIPGIFCFLHDFPFFYREPRQGYCGLTFLVTGADEIGDLALSVLCGAAGELNSPRKALRLKRRKITGKTGFMAVNGRIRAVSCVHIVVCTARPPHATILETEKGGTAG